MRRRRHAMSAMPPTTADAWDNLRAPVQDGRVCVVPDGAVLAETIERNRALRRTQPVRLLGEEIPAWAGPPRILAGHQPEFLHPGVWAKIVIVSELARRLGGSGQFLIVDSDVPDPVALRWPRAEGERLEVRARPLLHSEGRVPYEGLAAGSSAEWRTYFNSALADHPPAQDSALSGFLAGFLTEEPPTAGSYGFIPRWAAGISRICQEVGFEPSPFTRVGTLIGGDRGPWWRFTAECLLQSDAVTAAYNNALEEFRLRRGIRGTRHPIANLVAEPGRTELPFWLYRGHEPRQRVFVEGRGSDGLVLWAGPTRVCEIGASQLRRAPGDLSAALGGWFLRPRALALTLFARLFCCDLFVHGLGGAKYDCITDAWIRRFLGVEPSAYACVTATLRLALPRLPGDAADLPVLRRAVREARFNPQRLLGDATDAGLVELLRARSEAIEESRQLRAVRSRDRATRRAAYERIHTVNCAIAERLGSESSFERRTILVREAIARNRIADSREWFVGLYPLSHLRHLRDRLLAALPLEAATYRAFNFRRGAGR